MIIFSYLNPNCTSSPYGPKIATNGRAGTLFCVKSYANGSMRVQITQRIRMQPFFSNQRITFAAENAESGLGISHRKNQYAITLQEDYIIAFYNQFCACQLSQHDLAVHRIFLHSLQLVLTCAGRQFSLTSLTMVSPNLRLFPMPATQVPGFLRPHTQYVGLSRWISVCSGRSGPSGATSSSSPIVRSSSFSVS